MFGLAVGASLAMVLLLGACGTGDSDDHAGNEPDWGDEALDWAAARADGLSTASLAAADVVAVNQRGKGRTTEGRQSYAQTLQEIFGANPFDQAGVFVDVETGIVLMESEGVGPSRWYWATHDVVDAAGIHFTRAFISLEVGRSINALYGPAFDHVEELARAYVSAWTADDPQAPLALYDPAAVMTDSLRGTESFGRAQIVADSVASGWPAAESRIELESVGADGVAIYYFWRRIGQPDEMLLVLGTIGESGCPRRMAVLLGLAQDQIVSERRFHEIESFRRCQVDDPLPVGWWTGLNPLPAHKRITGAVDSARGDPIVVRGGSAALDGLVVWGLERFSGGGLDEPIIGSVTFAPLAHECVDRAGSATVRDQTHEVIVCLDESTACTDDACTEFTTVARLGILHELAHVWLREHVDESGEREFVAHADLETWSDQAVPWPARGVEQAAEMIAWGLMDLDLPLTRIGSPSCAHLTTGYLLLTGADPPRTCPEH